VAQNTEVTREVEKDKDGEAVAQIIGNGHCGSWDHRHAANHPVCLKRINTLTCGDYSIAPIAQLVEIWNWSFFFAIKGTHDRTYKTKPSLF